MNITDPKTSRRCTNIALYSRLDPQPVKADVIGTDGQGRTTWALQTGVPSGTITEGGFPGTATLVEGSDYASLNYVLGTMTLTGACSIANGLAVCSDNEGVHTETASPFAVQVGTGVAASASATAATSVGTGVGGPASSGGASGTSRSVTGSGQQAPTTTPNSSRRGVMMPLLGTAVLSSLVAILLL
ncbi:hypothetical protein BD779DRAFT_1670553 [Infundibulicybe gibba]|nr:hypothetical protein BD779DRAFT_1670553 [Infundibulicybe gibba]